MEGKPAGKEVRKRGEKKRCDIPPKRLGLHGLFEHKAVLNADMDPTRGLAVSR